MGIKDLFSSRKKPQDVYLGLRDRALHLKPEEHRLAASALPGEAWGVVMDWGVGNGTATVLALADGTASIYLSGGGGYLGGQGLKPVRDAAQLAVKIAATVQAQLRLAENSFPLPAIGEVTLYVHTNEGLLVGSASASELQSNKHPLSPLANAMQNVITKFRESQKT